MLKLRRVLITCLLLMVCFGLGWIVAGPKVLASISVMEYKEANYHFFVETDEVLNEETRLYDPIGIIVAVTPDQQPENASAFSEAYLAESYARAADWFTERSPDQSLDILLVFSHPLTLDEANQVLKESNATVFESGVVGAAADGTPFASYSIEEGPYLNTPLDSITFTQFSGITDENESLENVKSADVHGYMSLRVWVNPKGLQHLLDSKLVQMVDTTPQMLRDRLAVDRHWKDTPITHLAIEMPVWAYSWEG